MPNMNTGRLSRSHKVSQLCSKSQLINQVKPMVSGHLIVKPTITLQRLNLQDVPASSPVEQMQSPLPELEEADQIEDVDATGIRESSTDSSPTSSDEEECVGFPHRQSTRKISAFSSSVTSHDLILPVAVVPLERVSLPKIAQEKNVCHQLIMESDNTVLIDKDTSATSQHSSMLSLSERHKGVSEICRNIQSVETIPDNTVHSVSKDTAAVVENESVLTNQRSNNCSVRKYPPSSRTKTPTSSELWNSQTNYGSEKCRLVVALTDIRSCLHNGILTNTEKLEEGKLRIDAVLHPESKEKTSEGGDGDAQLNMSDTSVESQTQLNFTAGIGTLDYTAVSLNNCAVEGTVLTPREEFLNRIRNEDPLEGSSWHYQNNVTAIGRKRKSQPFHSQESTTKENSGNQWAVSYISPEKLSSDRFQHHPTRKHNGALLAERGTTASDEDMDITECMPFCIVTSRRSTSLMGKEANNYSVRNSVLHKESGPLEIYSTKEAAIVTHRKKPRKKHSCDTSDESVSEEEWKPKESRRKNSKQCKARVKIKCKRLPKSVKTGSTGVAEESAFNRKQSVEHRETLHMSQSRNTSPQLECINNDVEKENVDNVHVRAKRRAAPTSLKEASLQTKMRRGTH